MEKYSVWRNRYEFDAHLVASGMTLTAARQTADYMLQTTKAEHVVTNENDGDEEVYVSLPSTGV